MSPESWTSILVRGFVTAGLLSAGRSSPKPKSLLRQSAQASCALLAGIEVARQLENKKFLQAAATVGLASLAIELLREQEGPELPATVPEPGSGPEDSTAAFALQPDGAARAFSK